jgi:signal transduction histidine kinase
MQVVRRAGAADLGMLLDVGLAVAGTGLTALALWVPSGPPGTAAAAPAWLLAVLSLMMGAPLALRRRAPLVMWAMIWAGFVTQALTVHELPQGLEMVVLCAACYALGAYSSMRRSVTALLLAVPAMAVCVLAGRWNRGAVLPFPQFFIIGVVALWLTGVGVRARRQAAALAARNAELERQAEEAAAAERARIARELHDIVAHHLSVMVLQAAGARASGKDGGPALEKIERSGRQALAETRRLLGVLRDSQEDDGLAPQPGISDLAALADSVRAAGVPVSLTIHDDHGELPEAVGVSAYRIIQEALTNVLKHAGPAHADVTVGCAGGAVMIEVTDDGPGTPAGGADPAGVHLGGQGLAGMRERVAVFGGELQAGSRPGGGFAVRARLPLGDAPSLGATPSLGDAPSLDDALPVGDALP